MNDNRNYKYSKDSKSNRQEFDIISKFIKPGSKVIDLGSGDGTLLKLLKDKRNTIGIGIEISASGVDSAKKKGVKSEVGRIDVHLPFKNKEFDYSICNVTVQMVTYPEVLLSEMKRISKTQIVTFPNFAFIINRLDMMLLGRMPKFMLFGYNWYSTGHIHQLSIADMIEFANNNNLKILKTSHIGPRRFLGLPTKLFIRIFPNLFATMGIFLLEENK